MDNFLLQSVVDEIGPQLVGERIGRVFQSGETDLIVDLRQAQSLFIRTDPDHLAVYLGHRQTDDDQKARQLPPFAIQLRKALGSARIDRIEKLGDDRVVEFAFHKLSESGEPLKLVASLTGRSADILLLEGERVAASLRGRDLGSVYHQPKPIPDRVDPIDLPSSVWLDIVASSGGDVEIAGTRLLGFNDVYCAELAFLSRSHGPERALQTLVSELCRRPGESAIYSNISLQTLREQPGIEGLEFQLTPIPLRHLDGQLRTPFSSMSAAAESYYEIQDARRAFAELRRNAASEIRSQLKKQTSLHEKLSRDLGNCANADRDQRLGEILLANLHNIAKSGSDFVARDYFEPGEPVINIPDQNTSDARLAAEQYFRRSRKARRGVIEITKRLAIAEDHTARLQSILAEVTAATNAGELRNSLPAKSASPVRGRTKSEPKGKKQETPTGVRRYRSSDGFEILVGRTDRDNDNLTTKIARSSDLWFHAADYPGSHVVLRNPQRKTVAPGSIRQAAELAAKFSQAKNDAKVAVNYCERKFVSKPKGFPPGQVRLSSFKTILVEPQESAERIL